MKINILQAMFTTMSGFILAFVHTQLPKALAQKLQAGHYLSSLLDFNICFSHQMTIFWLQYPSGRISRPVCFQWFLQMAV